MVESNVLSYNIPVPVQKHSQVFIDISLRIIVRKLLKIQDRLRDLQAIGVDSTVRVLSQAEFLSEKRNAIIVSWYGLNRLVQMSFVHLVTTIAATVECDCSCYCYGIEVLQPVVYRMLTFYSKIKLNASEYGIKPP